MKKAVATMVLALMFFRLFALAGGVEFVMGDLLPENGDRDEAAEDALPATDSPPEGTAEPAAQTASESHPATAIPIPKASPEPQDDGEDAEILATTINGGLTLSNATSYEPDVGALLAEGSGISLPAEGPQILIIHTHGSEAYAQDDFDKYEESGVSRTQDKNYSVIRVGDELAERLEEIGLNVIHDRGIYDYPSYTGSYSRSQAAIESYLAQYPGIAVVIDLHRDALGTGDVIYKTMANVQGETSSQLMLLVGTGENGLEHPLWQENLKLALAFQQAVNNRYPTLARPIALKQERYNQHLTTGSLILEVGSSGNTLNEALSAIRLFAEAVGDTLLGMVNRG